MVTQHIETILYVTGGITAAMFLQFMAPRFFLKNLAKISLEDEAGLFYARHWALLVSTFGVLLVYAAIYPEIRKPILIAAAVEKGAFVLIIFSNLSKEFARRMVAAAVFDTFCVIAYLLYLTGIA